MISDYSEVTATLQKKCVDLQTALADNKYYIAEEIAWMIREDMDLIMSWCNEKV